MWLSCPHLFLCPEMIISTVRCNFLQFFVGFFAISSNYLQLSAIVYNIENQEFKCLVVCDKSTTFALGNQNQARD